jgi:hypothetical protein
LKAGKFQAKSAVFPAFVGAIIGVDCAVIDADRSRFQCFANANGSGEVTGKEVGDKTIRGSVGTGNGIFDVRP